MSEETQETSIKIEDKVDNTKETTTEKKSTKKTVAKKSSEPTKKDYPRKDDGSIDWFAVIPEKFIVAQDKSKSNVPVSELKDNEKMVLLGGWKYLLKERGYISKRDIIHTTTRDYVAITCEIIWQAHEDSGNKEQTYQASADSHFDNTDGFMQNFLTTNAQNRAFARCVREYLNIHVVGKDETNKATIDELLSMNQEDKTGTLSGLTQTPHQALQNKLNKIGKGLNDAKKWLIFQDVLSKEEAEQIKDWKDIAVGHCYAIINYLTKKAEEEIKEKENKKSE